MLDDQAIIGLPGFKIISVKSSHSVVFTVHCTVLPQCPHCSSEKCRIKDTFVRTLRHETHGSRNCTMLVKTHKFLCKECGKYFNQRLPGVLPYARATEPFKKEVCMKHAQGISQHVLRKKLHIGSATIERWYQKAMERKIRELSLRDCPEILGIDEHFFTKKKGYATTFVNLRTHRVFDVVLGRSEHSLMRFLNNLRGREKVKVIVMDLSETYRKIAKKYFPNAMIVADRFHVIRLINHNFLNVWKHFDEEGRKNRGLLSLMRRHEWNLQGPQKQNLMKYFQNVPVMSAIYDFKQDLCKYMLLKTITHSSVRKYANEFISHLNKLQDHPLKPLKTLGETLSSWFNEVVRMWRFTKTNSITEGLHTRMEEISRRAYGFKNFNNYRLRVLVMCG